jgi:hypothetical protein
MPLLYSRGIYFFQIVLAFSPEICYNGNDKFCVVCPCGADKYGFDIRS